MKHVIEHGVTQAKAKQAIKASIDDYSCKFPPYHPDAR